jgi:putative FmdB family regulatory protein
MTYLYRCEKGHKFEAHQKILDKPHTKCIFCKAKCARVPNNETGFTLVGSGWPGKDGKGK